MGLTTGSIRGTGIPFSAAEYDRRLRAVVAALETAELDALAVTSHASLEYLSGYPVAGGYFAPFTLIVASGHAPVFVVREYDRDAVCSQSWIDDVLGYGQESDQPRVLAEALADLGLARARIGFELGTWNLAPRDVAVLQEALPDLRVTDATPIVPTIAAVKSDAEIEVMRASAALTDLAVKTFFRTVRPGISERAVSNAIDAAVVAAGGATNPPYPVLFGQRTSLAHGAPSDFLMERNQVGFTELAGWSRGYAAASCRTLVVGRHDEAESLHALAEAALNTAIEAIRPGRTAGEVDAACRDVIRRAGRLETFRHRTGYQDGIRWFYRGGFTVGPDSPTVLVPGMTMHLAINLFERGRFGVGASHSVLVTPSGAERLTRSSTALVHVG